MQPIITRILFQHMYYNKNNINQFCILLINMDDYDIISTISSLINNTYECPVVSLDKEDKIDKKNDVDNLSSLMVVRSNVNKTLIIPPSFIKKYKLTVGPTGPIGDVGPTGHIGDVGHVTKNGIDFTEYALLLLFVSVGGLVSYYVRKK